MVCMSDPGAGVYQGRKLSHGVLVNLWWTPCQAVCWACTAALRMSTKKRDGLSVDAIIPCAVLVHAAGLVKPQQGYLMPTTTSSYMGRKLDLVGT